MDLVHALQTIPELKLEYQFMNFEWFYYDITRYGIKNGKNSLRITDIKSDEIRKYYIKKYLKECLTHHCDLK